MPEFFKDAALTIGWAIVGALSMGISFTIFIKVFAWFTPIDEWEEIKKGNMAAAVLIAAGIIATALVVAVAIMPGAEP
jgi:uncharacterized membrane protein YjfL (UPF0719 family)